MYKTLVNNGINYLSTGAGFCPSTVSSYSQVHETREMVGHQRDPLKVGSFPSSSSLSTFPLPPSDLPQKSRISVSKYQCGFTWVSMERAPLFECFRKTQHLLLHIHFVACERIMGRKRTRIGNDSSWVLTLFCVIWKWYTDTASVCVYIYISCVIYYIISPSPQALICIAASSPQFFDKFTKRCLAMDNCIKLANVGPSSSHFPCSWRSFEDVLATLLRIS